MKRELSAEVRAQLELTGVAMVEVIGGTKKTRYWTPDGREILAVPSMRNWVKKKDGKVIDSGIRDANLDGGWLLQPPTEPKLRCYFCDRWHDTQKEIDACGAKKKAFDNKWAKKVKRLRSKEGGELEDVKAEVAEIKNLLMQLLGKK